VERHKVRFSVLCVEHPFGSFMVVFDFVLSMIKNEYILSLDDLHVEC
jgi:hypothetical protein